MVAYDRTFCSNTNCKDKKCNRNQNNYDFSRIQGEVYLSIAEFKECEKFEGSKIK